MTTLFENATLLDVEAGVLRPGTSVLVDGDRIAEVSGRPITTASAERIDCRGRTLMPGLIDAHVHATITTMDIGAMARRPLTLVAQEARVVLEAMVRRGFTTVRDVGGADHGLAKATEAGLIRGPRLFYSGRVLSQTGGHGDFRPLDDAPHLCACTIHTSGFSHVADGADAVRRAAREELRRGASQVKIMASGGVASPSDPIWVLQYSHDEMAAAVEEAHSWRTYVCAHAYTPEAIQRAVRAGVRSIEHGNLLDDATAALMASHDAFLVPTLVTYAKIAELGAAFGFPAASVRKVQDVIAGRASARSTGAARAGVAIGFGTDLLGRDAPVPEPRVRDPSRAMAGDRRHPAPRRSSTPRSAGAPGELGVVKPGALADLLLVDGDPLRDIALLDGQGEHLLVVMRGGQIFHRNGA
jgi:imidazolonepropionase-like amidohydrolase